MKISMDPSKLLLFIVLIREDASATVTSSQSNSEVMVGGTTSISCVTSIQKEIHWYHFRAGSSEQIYVYAYGKLHSPYTGRWEMQINSTMGLYQLVIREIELTDAGLYVCQEDDGSGDSVQTQLTVLEAGPSCTSSKTPIELIGPNSCNKQPENVTLSCSVGYRGNISPELEWKVIGSDDKVTQGVNEEKTGNLITSHLTISSQPVMDGSSYICQTAKTRFNCTSDTVKIIYAINGNEKRNAQIGETVVCKANASQECTYKWKWFKNDDTLTASNNQTLIPKQSGDFRCEGECLIRKERCPIIAMFAYVEGDNTTLTTEDQGLGPGFIVLIVFIVVAIIVVIILVFVLYYRLKIKHHVMKENVLLAETEEIVKEIKSTGDIPILYSRLPYLDNGSSGQINGPFHFQGSKCACQRIMFSPTDVSNTTTDRVLGRGKRWMELSHGNILKFYDVLLKSPALYVVMEIAEGRSIRKALNSCKEDLGVDLVKNWATQIANGMHYLHSKEIVHRHLKAARILLMERFDPSHPSPKPLKIASYRLTAESGQSTDQVSFKGMFAWMAPEEINKEPAVKANDVWSYGVTVWEILTRKVPYKGENQVKVIKNLTDGNSTLLVPDRCPQPIRKILQGCWQQKVTSRSTFSEILSLLMTTLHESRCSNLPQNKLLIRNLTKEGALQNLANTDHERLIVEWPCKNNAC